MAAALALVSISVGGGCADDDTSCKVDLDCEGALVCKVSTGSCEPYVCKVDTECASGQTCNDNACQ